MVIVSNADTSEWVSQNIHHTVADWFASNSGKWISDCATANNFSYQQVAWSLGYNANLKSLPLMALPTTDSELSLAIQLNALWNS